MANRKNLNRTVGVIVVVILVAAGVWWQFLRNDNSQMTSTQEQSSSTTESETEAVQSASWTPQARALQGIVEDFIQGHKGDYSVYVMQPETGAVLADYQSDEQDFAASLYKLWVAYEGYKKVDDGSFKADESYISGYTLGECLDAMIRDSYSPCAEAMWAEIGKEELTQKASEYGAKNTDMTSLRTTAYDVAQILKRIANGEGLSKESKEKYLDSMKTQDALYRRGLPNGFSESVTTYNKVGWNELIQWHDGAIVDFGSDKRLVVVVMSRSAGMANVAALAKAIEANLAN